MSTSSSGLGRVCVLVLAVGGLAAHAHALTYSDEIGDVSFTIYAPDWTWQDRDVNILVVLENTGTGTENVEVRLVLPEGKEDHFGYDGPDMVRANLAPDTVVRRAFAGVLAKPGVPRQVYDLGLTIETGHGMAMATYPLRTVRGQAFSGDWWAPLFVPPIVALAWCAAFVIALRKFASPRAWRTNPPPVEEPETKEPWIDQMPT